jgi:hypothetical protein
MVPRKTRGFPVSAYWFILLQPPLAYFEQSELPLAPSFTLWHMSSTASCCLPQPPMEYIDQPEVLLAAPFSLSGPMQPNLLVSFSLSGLRHTATTACCLLQPPTAYIDQPEVLLAAFFSLYDLCHEAKPACLLQPLLASITLRSTGRQHSHYF